MPPERVVTLCDNFASVTIKIFDHTAFLRDWTTKTRTLTVFWNFVLLLAAWIVDCVFLTCWNEFSREIPIPPDFDYDDELNSSKSDDSTFMNYMAVSNDEIEQKQSQLKITNILYGLYLTCFILSTILIPFHIPTHAFVLFRQSWRQSLVLILELGTIVFQIFLPPILVFLLFTLVDIRPNHPTETGIEFGCQWQMLTFSSIHILVILWQCLKLIFLGLCCCCCSGIFATIWPCHVWATRDTRSESQIECCTGTSALGGKVLSLMPPETDRGSWLNGVKWCVITCWTFPVSILALASCVVLMALMITGENFLYVMYTG